MWQCTKLASATNASTLHLKSNWLPVQANIVVATEMFC